MEIRHPQLVSAREALYEFCVSYGKLPKRGGTTVIYGDNGAGKTRLLKLVNKWAKSISILQKPVIAKETDKGDFRHPSVEFCSWAEIIDGLKQDEWGKLEDLRGCELLIVDDLGAEHDPSRIGIEKLYVMLNHREYRWNLFSTNIGPGQWAEKFEKRIASRLFRNANHIDLSKVKDFSIQ